MTAPRSWKFVATTQTFERKNVRGRVITWTASTVHRETDDPVFGAHYSKPADAEAFAEALNAHRADLLLKGLVDFLEFDPEA